MATRPSQCRDGDGPDQEDLGDNMVEPLTDSNVDECEAGNSDMNETTEIERVALDTDEVQQPLFGRWAVFSCAIANFGLGLSLPMAMSTMFIDWQDTFKISRAHTVIVQSTTVGIIFGAAVIPGYLMERYGARFTVLLGCCLCSVGCFISIFATSINYLIGSVGVLGGLGFCFIQLPSIPSACEVFSKHGSIVVSLCTCGSAAMGMTMPFVYRYLIDAFSWRGTFLFITALCMQTAVLGLIMTSHLKAPLRKASDDLLKEDSLEERNVNGEITMIIECMSGEETISLGKVNDTVSCTGDKVQDQKLNSDQISDLRKPSPLIFRILNSKWKFLIDGMYVLVMIHIATCLAVQFSFAIIVVDFARTKGFPDPSTGPFFLLVIFLSGLVGRLIIGALNLLPFLHSITLMGIFGAISSFGMIMLGSATSYIPIVVLLGFQGFGVGGVVSIYAKCILDTDMVNLKNYPLALGLSCTWEGIFDFLIPVLIGHAVDTQGSYTMILQLLGSISLVSSVAIIAIKLYHSLHTCRQQKSAARNST